MAENQPQQAENGQEPVQPDDVGHHYYRIRFREQGQEFTASSDEGGLLMRELVMVRTDHGPEPALIASRAAGYTEPAMERSVSYELLRRASQDEAEKFGRLDVMEQEAQAVCQQFVDELRLPMSLVRVERYFNGSKIIFYFTAESRVDFRELVKRLVQEFRTRVEMRQIGVRHETQMIGGIGSCGRELCCTSHLKSFDSVSIKMAKAQDLPLNPAKISGVCNRLLCCLTYEYEAYRKMKKGMPRLGRIINFEEQLFKVVRLVPLNGTILAVAEGGEERVFREEEWRRAEVVVKAGPKKQGEKGQDRARRSRRKQTDQS